MSWKIAVKAYVSGVAIFVGMNNSLAQQNDNKMKSMLDSTVDRLVKVYMSSGKRVAVSVGVSHNGRSYTYNYGETSPGSGTLPTAQSIYEIGSITKTFTGLLTAHAIVEEKLTLNDDIRKYLPASFSSLCYASGEPVKLGYLLAHTAQLPNSLVVCRVLI